MSLARTLTTRLRRNGASPPTSPLPTDANPTMKRMASTVDRAKISSPVELISSTNMLSYDAPDVATIREMRQISSSSSSSTDGSSAGDDSDSSSDNNNRHSAEDLTDASSVDVSPIDAPEHNHLSCYFDAAQDESKKSSGTNANTLRRSASSSLAGSKKAADSLAPAIPHRALSHSKSSHLALARKRSLQSLTSQAHQPGQSTSSRNSLSSSTLSRSNSAREHGSPALFSSAVADAHPFGRELAKLSEVAEELGGVMRDAEDEDDAAVMRDRGLTRWTADDYLQELGPLYLVGFGANHPTAVVPAWI